MNETKKVAIVTGASRGIGAAIASRLAADGFTVVVNYAGNVAEAERLVASIEAAGGRAIPAQADVSDGAAVARMFDAAQAAFGGVDVIVNNAGIMKLSSIADTEDALFDSHIAINLKGSFNMLREAAKRLREGGRIINLSSSVVGLYPAQLRRVRRHQGWRGSHDPRPLQGTARPRHHGECRGPRSHGHRALPRRQAASRHRPAGEAPPLERLGQPEDIASAVAFLAGPDGAWINGQVLRANGGVI